MNAKQTVLGYRFSNRTVTLPPRSKRNRLAREIVWTVCLGVLGGAIASAIVVPAVRHQRAPEPPAVIAAVQPSPAAELCVAESVAPARPTPHHRKPRAPVADPVGQRWCWR